MRRQIISAVICLLLLISLGSCRYDNSPKSVARRFLIYFNKMDFDRAKGLSTKKTWDVLNIMTAATKNVSEEQKKEYANHFIVKILNVAHESDTTAIVTFQTKPKRLPFNQLRLFKNESRFRNIEWKVDISTLDLLNSDRKKGNLPPGFNKINLDSLNANIKNN